MLESPIGSSASKVPGWRVVFVGGLEVKCASREGTQRLDPPRSLSVSPSPLPPPARRLPLSLSPRTVTKRRQLRDALPYARHQPAYTVKLHLGLGKGAQGRRWDMHMARDRESTLHSPSNTSRTLRSGTPPRFVSQLRPEEESFGQEGAPWGSAKGVVTSVALQATEPHVSYDGSVSFILSAQVHVSPVKQYETLFAGRGVRGLSHPRPTRDRVLLHTAVRAGRRHALTSHNRHRLRRLEQVGVGVGVWVCGCVGVWVCGRQEEGAAVFFVLFRSPQDNPGQFAWTISSPNSSSSVASKYSSVVAAVKSGPGKDAAGPPPLNDTAPVAANRSPTRTTQPR